MRPTSFTSICFGIVSFGALLSVSHAVPVLSQGLQERDGPKFASPPKYVLPRHHRRDAEADAEAFLSSLSGPNAQDAINSIVNSQFGNGGNVADGVGSLSSSEIFSRFGISALPTATAAIARRTDM